MAFLAFGVIPIAASESWRRTIFGATIASVIFLRNSGSSVLAVAVMLAVLLSLGALAMPWIKEFRAEMDRSITAQNSPLRTRPLYRPDDERARLIVLECERRAIEEGRLYNLMRNDEKRATEHFRLCLGDQGLDWETCGAGDDGCGLFRYLGMRSPAGTFRSQFVD